ncbi:ABC transporter permease [Mycoplasmatota bacterium WC30]
MIISLIKRNLKVYFRDRLSVFFSMLGVFIIIMLFLLFLGDMMVNYAMAEISEEFGVNIRFLMDSWIMAGVVTVATITTTLGAYGVMVMDNSSNVIYDFKVSPIKRSTLVLSYILSAFLVGIIMSSVSLAFGEVYILVSGGKLLSFLGFIKTFGVIMLSVIMSASIIFFIISFVKSNNAFGAVSSVFGSIIGFLMGVYIPLGNLPIGLQSIIKFFPFAHPAVLMRQTMMAEAVDLSYMPEEFMLFTAVNFKYNDIILPVYGHILIILGISILFFVLGVLVISRKRKK